MIRDLNFRGRVAQCIGYMENPTEFWIEEMRYLDGDKEEIAIDTVTTEEWADLNKQALDHTKDGETGTFEVNRYEDEEYKP